MTILPTPHFAKEAKALTRKYPSLPDDLEGLFKSLEEKPTQGTSLGNDCYKIRLAIKSKGKGKSGGARLITLVRKVEEKILLLTIYDKSQKMSVSDQELKELVKDIPDHLK
jgi:hypothetical protein